jgi:hypothetical protein
MNRIHRMPKPKARILFIPFIVSIQSEREMLGARGPPGAIQASADLRCRQLAGVSHVKAARKLLELADQAATKSKFYRTVAYP